VGLVPGQLSWHLRGTMVVEQTQLWQAHRGRSVSEYPWVVSSLMPASFSTVSGGCRAGRRKGSGHRLVWGCSLFLVLALLQGTGDSHPAKLGDRKRGHTC
jgi:hypothetical protein